MITGHAYIAAPFFTEKQKQRIHRVVDMVKHYEIIPYLPMEFMVLKPDASKKERKSVFFDNVTKIARSDMMIAILDEKDTGTLWEMGCAYGMSINVISVYVESTPQVNVMLEQGCHVMCNGIYSLEHFLKTGQPITNEVSTQ